MIAIDENNSDAYEGLGRLARQAADHAGALTHFQKALALRPTDRSLRETVADSLMRLNRFEEAAQTLQSLAADVSGDDQAQSWRARS